jgi:6-pyruvoyltetrahydropterin/6-carboxytetrahydropterin synthase
MRSFRIHVAKEYLGFSSGHFITYNGHQCEPLHGHNYRARISLEGALDQNFYVVDFSHIKRIMKRVCDSLDHRMLVPLQNALLTLEITDEQVKVCYAQRCYVFPREDVVLLPIPNTTAEMLAQYICGQVMEELRTLSIQHMSAIEIEVEESLGQAAIYREEFATTSSDQTIDANKTEI